MIKVWVRAFGDVDKLEAVEEPDPVPADDQVVVRMTSIGMNHAELMQRRGTYRASSGDPPFVPGLEGGGVIHAVGRSVTDRFVGQRVTLTLDAPRRSLGGEGSYQSHYLTRPEKTVPTPEAIPDHLLGALWLPYLTAWGALIWKQQLGDGQAVLVPAASSSVGLAASQVAKEAGATVVGTTTSPEKVDRLRAMPEATFDEVVLTREEGWRQRAKELTGGRGFAAILDPVGAGPFVSEEIRLLASYGTLWIYGLLGERGEVDLSPLILRRGAVRGWAVRELAEASADAREGAYRHVLQRVADGRYSLPVGGTFPLGDVRTAHRRMEEGRHVGKLILLPDATTSEEADGSGREAPGTRGRDG